MVTSSATTFRLYSLLFLLVPGYVFLRMYLRGHVILDSFSRLDKLLLLIAGGFISLVIVSFGYRAGVDYWILKTFTTDELAWYTGNWRDEITLQAVSNISILETFLILSVQSCVAGSVGYYSGKAHRKYGSGIEQTRVELTQPWEVAFEESNKGDKVRIITAQGREIEGLIEQMGSPSENYDLLLSDPKELTRSSTDVTRRDIGQTTYHHFQDISRIEFEKELIPEQDPTPIELFRQRISEGRNGVSKTLLKFLSSLIGVVVSKEESETRGDRMEVSAGTVNFKIIAEEPADEKDSSDEE